MRHLSPTTILLLIVLLALPVSGLAQTATTGGALTIAPGPEATATVPAGTATAPGAQVATAAPAFVTATAPTQEATSAAQVATESLPLPVPLSPLATEARLLPVSLASETVVVEPPPVAARPESDALLPGPASGGGEVSVGLPDETTFSELTSPPLTPKKSKASDTADAFRDPSPPGYWKTTEPQLIIGASIKPREEDEAEKKKAQITGMLSQESHRIKRKKAFKRWVLELKEGKKIPLVANLSLMFALQQTSPASGPVTLNGSWVESKAYEGRQYFSVERIQPAMEETASPSVPVDETGNDDAMADAEAVDATDADDETASASEDIAPSDEVLTPSDEEAAAAPEIVASSTKGLNPLVEGNAPGSGKNALPTTASMSEGKAVSSTLALPRTPLVAASPTASLTLPLKAPLSEDLDE